MSLIEQAAKRLEELRRAGATQGDDAPAEAPREPLPTPEALVRALEARREANDGVAGLAAAQTPPLRVAPAGEAPLLRPAREVAKAPARTTRHVDVDLERLKTLGFVTPDAPQTQLAEEFRVVKRPILRNVRGTDGASVPHGNLVMVTSAVAGEGKTFTAVNLAISMAMEYDNTVLLVDGDVAHPSLPRLFGVPESPGLLDLLTDERLDVADALVRTNIEKLTVLPAGTPHRRSTELLASEQMAALLSELSSRYPDRVIIFDSPPLLSTTEARVLASHMGQVLVVVAAQSTSHDKVTKALDTIERCEVVMTLLNKSSAANAGAYRY